MKVKITITVDYQQFEKFKNYVYNVSGFLNSTIKNYVFYREEQDKILNHQKFTDEDIERIKNIQKIINTPWTGIDEL